MNFEELQEAWQTQDAALKVTINTEVLLNEVRRNQRQLHATIFWRDAREAGTSVVMTLVFLVWGIRWGWWSLYLQSLCCFAVGLFFLVDRLVQRRKQPAGSESLHACIAGALLQLNHQIRLLKNVFWWYLLPILIGLAAVSASMVWDMRHAGPAIMIGLSLFFVLLYGTVYWGVYRLNQRAVRTELEPRRKELEIILASLQENSPQQKSKL